MCVAPKHAQQCVSHTWAHRHACTLRCSIFISACPRQRSSKCPNIGTYMHARTHARTRARTHARTQAHTSGSLARTLARLHAPKLSTCLHTCLCKCLCTCLLPRCDNNGLADVVSILYCRFEWASYAPSKLLHYQLSDHCRQLSPEQALAWLYADFQRLCQRFRLRMHADVHAAQRVCLLVRELSTLVHTCTHKGKQACAHACTHERTCTCTPACRHACSHACTHMCMPACTRARTRVCTHEHMHKCTHVAHTHARSHTRLLTRSLACTHFHAIEMGKCVSAHAHVCVQHWQRGIHLSH